MGRFIQNNIKDKHIYKFFTLRDIILGLIAIMLTVIALNSKLKGKFYIAAGIMIVSGVLFLSYNDEKVYMHIFYKLVFICSKKSYTNKKDIEKHLFAFKEILKDGKIIFKNNKVGAFINIFPHEIDMLDQENQNILINRFAEIFKIVDHESGMKLIAIGKQIKYQNEKEFYSNLLTYQDDKSKKEILNEYYRIFVDMEKESPLFPHYILFFYSSNSQEFASKVSTICQLLKEVECHYEVVKQPTDILEMCEILQNGQKINKEDVESTESLLPSKIRYSKDYRKIDNQKIKMLKVIKYPSICSNGWLKEIINSDNTNSIVNIGALDKEKAIKTMDRTIMDLREKYNRTDIKSRQSELLLQINALENAIENIKINNEVLVSCEVGLIYYIKEKENARNIFKLAANQGMRISSYNNRQIENFRQFSINTSAPKDDSAAMLTEVLASSYPFIERMLHDNCGNLIGVDEYGRPVIIDFDKRYGNYTNSNVMIIGKAGSGKSYLTKLLFLLFFIRNEKVYVLDPENEYETLAKNIKAQIIDVAGGEFKVNPFEVWDFGNDDQNIFNNHLSFLDSFFSIVFEDLSNIEKEILNSLVVKMYNAKDINMYTNFKILDSEAYPTFSSLMECLKEEKENNKNNSFKEEFESLQIHLRKCTDGRYSMLWNGASNVRLSNNVVIFKFQSLFAAGNMQLARAQMALVSRYLNSVLINNYNNIKKEREATKISIIVDEAHKFIGENDIALQTMYNLAKQCRKYGGRLITITQSIADFLSSERQLKEAKAILSESQYSFILGMSAQHMNDLLKLYSVIGLSKEEEEAIKRNTIGRAFLISSNYDRRIIQVVANDLVREYFEKVDKT